MRAWLGVLAIAAIGCGDTTQMAPADLAGADFAGVDFAIPDLAGADFTCAGTPKSCGASGACVDCASSSAGALCVNGACGCAGQGDCPSRSACDTQAHVCGAACAGASTYSAC